MQTDETYFEKKRGYISVDAFKLPVTAVVKLPSTRGSISPEFESRLRAFAEDRHTLMHRWFLHRGWPNDDETERWQPLIELATIPTVTIAMTSPSE
jgi:hypothetical protein